MKVVPEAFYQNTSIRKLLKAGSCAVIHKLTLEQDLDNHRLLSAHAITLVIKGGLMVHCDEGLPSRVEQGQAVLLPQGLYAITDLIPKNAAFEALVFFFDNQLVSEFLDSIKVDKVESVSLKPAVLAAGTTFRTFCNQLLQLYNNIETPESLVRAKLLEALYFLNQEEVGFADKIATLHTSTKKTLNQFMMSHYDKPLDIEDFARLTGRSVSTFRRDFHREFDQAPKKWLIGKRLEKARKLLIQDVSVSSTAQQSGYTDIPHFIKSFQRAYTISPKQFALNHRN